MNEFNEANTIEAAICSHLSTLPGVSWSVARGSDLPREPQDVLIETWLKNALCRLNPDIAAFPENADEVIHKLRALLATAQHSGLIRANELFLEWLRGEKSMPLGEDGEHITINLIDYQDLSNNCYVISQQVPVVGIKNAILDLVLYVNGIPLVIGEVKTPVRSAISWQDGALDFMNGDKYYWLNQHQFFVPNLLCFATEGKLFRYAPIGAAFRQWMPWHRTTDDDKISYDISAVLTSAEQLLKPSTLLELLQFFALYSATSEAKRTKLLPRYPQYEAAKQIVKRVKSNQIRKGLIWHFQGSGKSLLMLYAAKMLNSDPQLKNPTVVIVVDRVDLDSQINSTFCNADVHNITPVQSCAQLLHELKTDNRNILVTTIFKFNDVLIDETNKDGINSRENIIVLVDEAHRTQEGALGEKMRWALPNAYFFGLTGTPISGVHHNTFSLFGTDQDKGHYMNRYSYKQSIRDKATLPIMFEPRLVELRVDREAIDKEFTALANTYHLNEEEKAHLSRHAGKLAHLLKAPKRITAIADDISKHFTSHVNPKGLKAMVVVYDREACVFMYDLLTKRLGKGSCEVVMHISHSSIDDQSDENVRSSQKVSDWTRWENRDLPLDKETFKRWQSIDDNSEIQKRVLDQYRDPSAPLKILIVTSKLLTGFDAPICYCMYLDKPLRDHTLLQAMCRTNRLHGDIKQYGLIIDYLGVFENLTRALAYDPKEIEGVVDQLGRLREQLPVALQKCLNFFDGVNRSIGGYEELMAAQNCLPSNVRRDEFAAEFSVLRKLWDALVPDLFLSPYRKDYLWLAQVYDSIRPVGGLGSLIWQSLGPETLHLIHQHTDITHIRDDLSNLMVDEDTISTLPDAELKTRAHRLEMGIVAKIRIKSDDPRYIALGERLDRLREKYEAGVLTSVNWLKDLLVAAREAVHLDSNADRSDQLIEDHKTALTELFRELRGDQTPEIVSRMVDDIDKIVKATRFQEWQTNKAGDREMRQALRKTLFKYQLHRDNELFDKAYAYIKEHY